MRIPMSELQAALAGCLSECLDTAVEEVSGPVKTDGAHPARLGALRDGFPDRGGACRGAAVCAAEGGTKRGLGGRRGDQGVAAGVVDELGADVADAPEYREPRTRCGAGHVLAHPAVAPRPGSPSIVLREHPDQPLLTYVVRLLGLAGLARLSGLAAQLLAAVQDPLPLVRLGLSEGADLGGHLTHHLLVRSA